MDVIKEKCPISGAYVYVYTLSSGIKCYIIPKSGFKTSMAMAVVKFGSGDTMFKQNGDFILLIYSSVSGIMLFRRHENKKPVVSCWLSVIRLYLAQRLSFAVFNCSCVLEAAFLMQSLIIWQALFIFLLSVWQHTDKTPVLGSILEKML